MSEDVNPQKARPFLQWGMRFIGLVLLVVIITRLDAERILAVLQTVDVGLLLIAFAAIGPLILIKTVRWLVILHTQRIHLPLIGGLIAYFSSLFIGFLTPGRLGEFVKALYVSEGGQASQAQGFASVLVDRLFDLTLLVVVGSMALPALIAWPGNILLITSTVLAICIPFIILANTHSFGWLRRLGLQFGRLGRALFGESGLVTTLRINLLQLTTGSVLVSALLTVAAYGVFFGQCYLIARALDVPVGFTTVMFAIALGSLVTLIPISISGLGTREATIITYLGLFDVPPEQAISFSLLVFAVFYLGGGVIGAVAWLIRPVPIHQLTSNRQEIDAS